MTQTQYCARHPSTETNIRCGRCEETICPNCLVHAPVGMRCPDCARVNVVPTYDVPLPFLLRGIAAGVAVGAVLGAVFLFIAPALFGLALHNARPLLPVIPYVFIVIIAATGFAVGEAVSISTNRKRGIRLKFVSAGSMFVASALISAGYLSIGAYGMLYLFIGLALATWLAIRPF